LESGQIVPLKELYELYSSECNNELLFCSLKTKLFNYHSATYRDLFMRYLPTMQVYKAVGNQTQAFILKKPSDKDFANVIETIKWPNRNELLQKIISKKKLKISSHQH